jgi:cell fate (sporulation/competence/biofilm development) regulator YmcA (YheA/YmcA/DUF963 family)
MDHIKNQIFDLQRRIHEIDNKPFYSLSYYFFNEREKREEMVKLIKDLEKEIEYIKDTEKRKKYTARDPLFTTKVKRKTL